MSTTSAPGLTALGSTLLGLSTIAVTLRFYARHTLQVPFKSDDWVMIPCLVLFIGTTACTFYGVQRRILGYPTPKDPHVLAKTAETASKLYIAFDFFSIATLGLTKTSAVLFYRRIFCVPGHRSYFHPLTLVTVVSVALWTVAFLLLSGLQCGTHFSALWSDYARYCHISHAYLLGFAISDLLLDIWIISLPLSKIWTLRMSLKRRLGTMGVFLLAFVGLAACIARLVVNVQVRHTKPIDKRLLNTRLIYLSVLEAGLSLIAVNLPSLWFLRIKIKPESVLRSVRSMISLRSERSAATLKSHSLPSSLRKDGNPLNSSHSYLAPPKANSIESYAMHDIEDEGQMAPMPLGRILVRDKISQSSALV